MCVLAPPFLSVKIRYFSASLRVRRVLSSKRAVEHRQTSFFVSLHQARAHYRRAFRGRNASFVCSSTGGLRNTLRPGRPSVPALRPTDRWRLPSVRHPMPRYPASATTWFLSLSVELQGIRRTRRSSPLLEVTGTSPDAGSKYTLRSTLSCFSLKKEEAADPENPLQFFLYLAHA